MIALAALLAALFVLLVFAARRPDEFRVARSVHVTASPSTVAPFVDDFRRWTAWSPWENVDPTMKRTYEGEARGVGAVYAWEGDGKVGAGRMEITACGPDRVVIRLDFSRPFEAHNVAEFTFEPAGSGTEVTWAMTGKSPLPMKVMGLFVDMDAMVGKDFVTGLANLKAAVERAE